MRLRVEQGERVRHLTAGPGQAPGQLAIDPDGEGLVADVRDLGNGRVSLRLPAGSMHDVVVESTTTPGARTIDVDGVRVAVTIAPRARRGGASGHTDAGPLRIVAPMPGKIVRVPVAPGDVVEAKQPV